jgi:methanol--5-hydroxybenzimidazolylcobamide Co-methyltransferase
MSSPPTNVSRLSVNALDEFLFATAPRPIVTNKGLSIGQGLLIPELNFTLPSMHIDESTWPVIQQQYRDIITSACKRAMALEVPGLLVEFETLPPMTHNPEWGLELTRILSDVLNENYGKYGFKSALRLTPNDTREHIRPPLMRRGEYWDRMLEVFESAGEAGADMLAIESTGGKEVSDEALMQADLRSVVFALGVLGARDMEFLWNTIVHTCEKQGIIPSGDTACGFANTAMVLAEQGMIPRLFAAVVRVACVPRSLVAYEVGARGPGKDCGYENPYIKAIAGVPISMEGRTAACAHLSPIGNIAQAVCDCWSNESVQNVQLLSTNAPTVYMEQLAYDCRLANVAGSTKSGAKILRDWLVESDTSYDPQAYVLRPDVVLRISEKIMEAPTPYQRTRQAVLAAVAELKAAHETGVINIPAREKRWLNLLQAQSETLPETEADFIAEMMPMLDHNKFLPAEYGLA